MWPVVPGYVSATWRRFDPLLLPDRALLRRSADIKEHVKQIEKAVSGKEPRFVLRALRALPSTSRRLNTNVVNKTICGFFTNNSTTRDFLLSFLEEVSVESPPGPNSGHTL